MQGMNSCVGFETMVHFAVAKILASMKTFVTTFFQLGTASTSLFFLSDAAAGEAV